MAGDRLAGAALLILLAGGFILVFRSFSAAAGLGILALLVIPFGIAGAVLWRRRREFEAPPAPGGRREPEEEGDDDGPPPGGYNGSP